MWRDKLIANCKLCKKKVIDKERINYCARKILSIQPDFQDQKGALEEIIKESGHLCIFYSKFHCELNFIEYFWDAVKKYTWNTLSKDWKKQFQKHLILYH